VAEVLLGDGPILLLSFRAAAEEVNAVLVITVYDGGRAEVRLPADWPGGGGSSGDGRTRRTRAPSTGGCPSRARDRLVAARQGDRDVGLHGTAACAGTGIP